MILTYNQKSIDFFNFDVPNKVLLSLSGGLDSASLLYIICYYIPRIEVIPFCAKDIRSPNDYYCAEKIVKWIQKEFPNNKINNLHVFDFDMYDLKMKKEIRTARKKFSYMKELPDPGVSKIIQLDNILKNIQEKYPDALLVDGITKNPPLKVMKKNNVFLEKAEKRRNYTKIQAQLNNGIYKPFVNVDKKFVADIYKHHNLLKTLYPLTNSCVGSAEDTNNHTKECHNCFWCYEKGWAFDLDWCKEFFPCKENKKFKRNFFHRTDRLNLDLSYRCPLECPHCSRQRDYVEKGEKIPGEDLTYENFVKITKFSKKIHFCGQLSDPVHHPNLIDFLKLCYERNIDTSIATASSFKSKNWYIEAFKSNPDAKWFFGIDGLPKDSSKYRINQDGEKLYNIMCESTKYLNHKPFWQYILFRYNQDDINTAIKLSKEHNVNFLLINSARWRDSNDKLIPTKNIKI